MKLPMWWNSFEGIFEKETQLASERLFFLSKYKAGDARGSIQGCLTLCADSSYNQAKSILAAEIWRQGEGSEGLQKEMG